MQIIIPMSGFGERFRSAGYTTPKPLIEVNGKTIIQHVTEMFPGDHEFIFICNEDHIQNPDYRMAESLVAIGRKCKVVRIAAHKLGPVHAVLQAKDHIRLDSPTIVNYADFTCRWTFSEFEEDLRVRDLDGSVPAYRGFHPHSGGATNYAYIREDDLLLMSIREKQPFTDSKTQEFASTGTYFYRSARLMFKYIEAQVERKISVNGEFYFSSSFDLMANDKLKVGVFNVEHFMQWGTPQDLSEYRYYSDQFESLASTDCRTNAIPGVGSTIFLASGLGSRFARAGYLTPKPLLEISGDTILAHALKQGPPVQPKIVTYLANAREFESANLSPDARLLKIDELTQGQAQSAQLAARYLGTGEAQRFTVFPTDSLFLDPDGLDVEELIEENFLIVWTMKPNPFALANSENFGWVWVEDDSVRVRIKGAPESSSAQLVSGAFTFSSKRVFDSLYEKLVRDNIRINGELYLDSMIEVANSIGLKVRLFAPKIALSFGTPNEFETFRYWQSCFDMWGHHPYSLLLDPFLDSSRIDQVRTQLARTAHLPSEWPTIE